MVSMLTRLLAKGGEGAPDRVGRTLQRRRLYLKTHIRHFRYNKLGISGDRAWTTPAGSFSSTPPSSAASAKWPWLTEPASRISAAGSASSSRTAADGCSSAPVAA